MASADAPSITVRDLLGTSLGAMGRNAGPLVLSAGLGLLPGVLLGQAHDELRGHGVLSAAPLLVHLAGALFAQACITHIITQDVRGRAHGGLPEALAVAASRMPTLAVVCALAWPVIIVGLVFLVVPGLLLWVMWFVAVQVALVEHRGPIDALRRSAELTRVGFWALFVSVLVIGAGYLLSMCGLATVTVFLGLDSASGAAPAGARFVSVTYSVLSQGLVLVALSTVATVFYVRAAERSRSERPVLF